MRWARHGMVAGLLAVLVAALLPGAVSGAGAVATTGRYDQAALRADLDAITGSHDIVGVLAQVDTGRRTLRARAGTAVVGGHRPVPWRAHFRAASLTKTFTATTVLQLVGEGRLSLSDTVERWLPGVVTGHGNDGRTITIRQLLQHTSGVADYLGDSEMSRLLSSADYFDAHRFDVRTPRQLVDIALRHPPVFTPPGSRWSYSNTNYLLLSMVIERATGVDWARQVERRILDPLRMVHTRVADGPFLRRPYAHAYHPYPDRDGRVDVTFSNVHTGMADSGIVSTTADVTRFLRALVRGDLLGPTELAEMRRVRAAFPPDEDEPGMAYGLGIMRTPLSCGGHYWHHTGDTLGFHTKTGITADGERSVVLVMTSSGAAYTPQVFDLIDNALCDRAA